MKRLLALLLTMTLLLSCLPGAAMAKKNTQMRDGVPVWTEENVRNYALVYISGKMMNTLWDYYDLQIRRYMPMTTFESMLTELEWMTGDFLALGTYSSFEDAKNLTKTHILHLCMEKQDLDMYFTHKNKENDWEIMAVEFVPAEKQKVSDTSDMLVDGDVENKLGSDAYTQTDITVGTAPYELKGILTMPTEASAEKPVPACVLVHDRGALDMHSTQGQTTLFDDLAYELADMGIASIRYDKRTFTYGESDEMTVKEEVVDDALAAGALLSQNALVDKRRIVVLGHGFGAMLAPRILSQSNGIFQAMVLIGGTPKTLLSVLKEEHASELAAMTEEERRVIENSIRKMADMKEEDARQLTLFGRNGYYYWEMERYDPVTLIKTTKAPA
ncbi:MAG: prolyl oligopeptidase family serine peptidase, partial [Clostridia bacterium]